jgi:hypothetical protein
MLTLPLGAHASTTSHPAGYYPSFTPDSARITDTVNSSKLIAVKSSQMAPSLSKYDGGLLPLSQSIRNVTLLLKRSDAKQKEFEGYLAQLSSPSSPYFHHWLTAKQIGTMFGPAPADIAKVTQWLQAQGLKLDSVSPSGMAIHFSGTASTVGNALHTSLHAYTVNGVRHFGNASVQQIPAALAPVVLGAASLGNFFPQPQHRDVGVVSRDKKTGAWKSVSKAHAQFTVPGGTLDPDITYDVAPADFNQIYNVNPLWNRSTPVRGAGQTVAVLERTDVLPEDVQTFRSAFLPANAVGSVSYINPALFDGDTSCPDPGRNGDEGEAALDTEWIGAAAPDAAIVFASCDDSESATFGPFTAAENLMALDVPPAVFSLSYGECEPAGFVDGIANEAGDLWSEAAAEGITVFVSTGDSGSAGCNQNQPAAYEGIAVNSMASTPYNVAVGGTDFNDFGNYGPYWSPSNLPLNKSAISYIPEQTWNNSCASSALYPLLGFDDAITACNSPTIGQFLTTGGGSGGPSTNWSQPDWQAGIYGSSNYGTRLMPDVSLFAANGLYGHALVFCMSDPDAGGTACDYTNPDNVLFNSAGGTSFAAPAMAGVQALLNQAAGQNGGNVLPAFYNIGIKEYGTNGSPNTASLSACNSANGANISSTCVFNNVTAGDIDEPCYAGTDDCFSGSGVTSYGVLSAGGTTSLNPAWKTNSGYSLATGLGSINAANLADALTKFDSQHKGGYVAPFDFVTKDEEGFGDGFSDIALVDPTKGIFSALGMKGSVSLSNASQSVSPGYTIGSIGNFFTDSTLLGTGRFISDLAWTGPDNQLYIWLSDGVGSFGNYSPHAVGTPFPAGWKLVGAGNFDGTAGATTGNPDELFWWNPATGQVGWWKLHATVFYILGRASYHFGVTISPTIDVAKGYVPTVTDVNGDGFADLVWTSTTDNSVYVWVNDQAGGFVKHQIANHADGFSLFGAGDINGDGLTDLIWTNPATNQMSWWVMNGFNVTAQQTRSVAAGFTMSSIADFDGDGLADILWANSAGDAYEWQGTGNGFVSFRVADASGKPLVIPAGAQIQANRLQGAVTGGVDTSVGISH